jgi:hypothetical protein
MRFVRYKTRLVAQRFTWETRYWFQWNIFSGNEWNNFPISYISDNTKVSIFTVDGCVTAYLYGSLDWDIYMKVPDRISVPDANVRCNMYYVKLNKSLYGLKQTGRMWYNRLKEFLLNKGYSNNDYCPCVSICKSSTRFCIMSVYVNDLNIIGLSLTLMRHGIILRRSSRWRI